MQTPPKKQGLEMHHTGPIATKNRQKLGESKNRKQMNGNGI